MRLIISIVFFVFFEMVSIFGQGPDIQLTFQELTLADDLSDVQYNNFVFQDSKGFTWISSIDGLNRFDGLTVKTYHKKEGLQDPAIHSHFFEDNHFNIWFSSYRDLHCYVRSKDSIITIPIVDAQGQLIRNNFRVFHLDQTNDQLWFRADSSFFQLNINSTTDYKQLDINTASIFYTVQRDSKGQVKTIVGSPWSNQSGLEFFYRRDTAVFEKAIYLKDFPNCTKSVYLKDSLWLFISNFQPYILDENRPADAVPISLPEGVRVVAAIRIGEDQLFLSTEKRGLWCYNWKKNEITKKWQSTENRSYDLATNSPMELYLSTDYLWTSHSNYGLNYSYLYGNLFTDPLADMGMTDITVTSLMEDEEGQIWVTTLNKGVFVFSSTGKYLFGQEEDFLGGKQSKIYQITKDKDDNVFIISNQDLLFFNQAEKKFKQIDKPAGIQPYYLSVLPDNRRLLSTYNTELQELIENEVGDFMIQPCLEFKGEKGMMMACAYGNSQGKVFVSNGAGELWVYENIDHELQLIRTIKEDRIYHNFTESKKEKNVTWAATSEGLIKIINDTIIQRVVDTRSVLKNKQVYGVIEDDAGKVWLSSNAGLWQYSPANNTAFQYGEVDGLSGEIFSILFNDVYTSDKKIWFGHSKGLVRFDPLQVKPYALPPNIYLNSIIVNDEDTIPGIDEIAAITFDYQKNNLALDVIGVGYYKSDKTKIAYQLGSDTDRWLKVNNGELIRFSKLSPADYQLKIKAIDANGNESKVKHLNIIIKPPFWQTWWFYLLCLGVAFFLGYLFYRYRINEIREKAQYKVDLVEQEMKTLRAQMNLHFLFNSMNSIKGIIIKQEIRKATEYLTKLSSLIRAILTNSEKKFISLATELEALGLYIELEALRFTADFNYQIKVDRQIEPQFARIPPLILQPFVENAIWHGLIPKETGKNILHINIIRRGDLLICEIEDNGVGRKKSNEKKDKKHQSMGIGITQKRIKLLHPDNAIEIIDLLDQDEQPQGTKVVITLYAPE